MVVYPPVTMMPALQKENLILSVGRFDSPLHNKRHDVLIEAFKQMDNPHWQLYLVGGSTTHPSQVGRLRKLAEGYPIAIVENPSWEQLSRLYGKARIYWHAAGFGEDLKKHPERAEHFGITTVEAMSARAVPIVFAGGGQLEIVHNNWGRTWLSVAELVELTQTLINSPSSLELLAVHAEKKARLFDQEHFHEAIKDIIG
jgi:glycosyltransferase involved in cell wall biosynthesis